MPGLSRPQHAHAGVSENPHRQVFGRVQTRRRNARLIDDMQRDGDVLRSVLVGGSATAIVPAAIASAAASDSIRVFMLSPALTCGKDSQKDEGGMEDWCLVAENDENADTGG